MVGDMAEPSQEYKNACKRMNKTAYTSIAQFTEDLIKIAHHKDEDGRDIGLDYDQIREAVLARFPKVLTRGPHQGKKTRLSVKEIIAKACDLNRDGIRLPFRPRRKSSAAKSSGVKAAKSSGAKATKSSGVKAAKSSEVKGVKGAKPTKKVQKVKKEKTKKDKVT